jgi:hypothetical protein
MKKVILSIIIVLSTILSCTYMLTYHLPKNTVDKSNVKVSENSNDAAATEKIKENKNNEANKTKEEADGNMEISVPETITPIDLPIVEEAKSVFKVSQNSLSISSLSNIDKLKLLFIYKKLDSKDEEKISEFLNEGNEDAVKNIFHLLRDRLSDDDYKSVEDITAPFINLDVAEN